MILSNFRRTRTVSYQTQTKIFLKKYHKITSILRYLKYLKIRILLRSQNTHYFMFFFKKTLVFKNSKFFIVVRWFDSTPRTLVLL
jgi:hypothetical protein